MAIIFVMIIIVEKSTQSYDRVLFSYMRSWL